MNGAIEPPGHLERLPTKTGARCLQVIERLPKQLLGHCSIASAIGVGEGVLRRGRGLARPQQLAPVMPQGIAHIVEAHRVGELRVEQRQLHATMG